MLILLLDFSAATAAPSPFKSTRGLGKLLKMFQRMASGTEVGNSWPDRLEIGIGQHQLDRTNFIGYF